MYGNYNFWSWFRYWYVDSCNLVAMILMDKGYFDYDHEKVEKPVPVVDWDDTIKSDEEVQDILSIFGLGRKQETEEDLQSFIIKEEEQKNGSRDSGSH